MSSYDLDRVIKLWERDQLTNEQAIGQLLLQVQALGQRVGELEKRLEGWQRGNRGQEKGEK